MKKFASHLPGLDTQKFDSCLDSGKYVSLVQSDLAFATSLGLQGTPAFIIEKSDGSNPELLPGAYPFPFIPGDTRQENSRKLIIGGAIIQQ